MTLKLLTKQHLEFLSLTGGCKGLSESIQVKIPHGWKSHRSSIMHDSIQCSRQCNSFIMLYLGSVGMERVISDPCYKGTCQISYNLYVKFHGQKIWES